MTVLDSIITATGALSRGSDRWSAHCPAHGSQRHRDLSIRKTDDRILLHCFAGCGLEEIVTALGITTSQLFLDSRAGNPRQRQAAALERQAERARREQHQRKAGRRIDALKAAESFVQSRQGIDISQWSDATLHEELNRLADAYTLLEAEAL